MLNRTLATILTLIATSVALASQANVESVPEFNGGVNIHRILTCEMKYQPDCPLARQNDAEALNKQNECINQKMSSNTACKQASLIRDKAFYPAKEIKKYGQVTVFYVTTLADGMDVFHMIDSAGNFISLTNEVNLSDNITFQSIKAQFPKAELTTILASSKDKTLFPQVKKIATGRELIFKQTLRDGGCVACQTVGVVDVAYSFTRSGVYQGVKVLGVEKE